MRIIGIIPARGGSKGVPRKNLAPVAGRPLLAYTAQAALGAPGLARVILSTEDEEIQRVGLACGLEAPFRRPAALAEDATPTLPVVRHAIAELEAAGERVDAICLLQPTNPLRTSEDIEGAVKMFEETGADTVISVLAVPHQYNPHWVYFEGAGGALQLATGEAAPIPRRQLLPKAFHREGSIYLVKRDVVMAQPEGSLYGGAVRGYLMEAARSVNIDRVEDLERAAQLLLQQAEQQAAASSPC